MKVTHKPIPPLARHCMVVLWCMSHERVIAPTRGLTRRRNPIPFHAAVFPMFTPGVIVTTEAVRKKFPDEPYGTIAKGLQGMVNRGTVVRVAPGAFRLATDGDY